MSYHTTKISADDVYTWGYIFSLRGRTHAAEKRSHRFSVKSLKNVSDWVGADYYVDQYPVAPPHPDLTSTSTQTERKGYAYVN
mgnify:CR=1 FL=1